MEVKKRQAPSRPGRDGGGEEVNDGRRADVLALRLVKKNKKQNMLSKVIRDNITQKLLLFRTLISVNSQTRQKLHKDKQKVLIFYCFRLIQFNVSKTSPM